MLRSIGRATVLSLCAGALVAAPADAQLPTVGVHATTVTLPNFGQHRGVTVTAGCPDGSRLVGGGSYLRNATDPATLPTNGLVLGGTLPSTGASPVDAAVPDQTFDVSHWTSIANFTGQSEAGDQAATFALCATGGPSRTVVVTKSTAAANSTQEVEAPNLTTATCPPASQLLAGGAMTRTPDQVDDGTAAGNNGNLKPLGSYPSDAAGVPAADGATDATSWTAYGSAGVVGATDEVTAFALCSIDSPTPAVRVARVDYAGPDAQAGTTTTASPVSCPAGTRLIGGGYKVDESVGATSGLQPQQGYHMRGSYPTADAAGTTEASDGAANVDTWTSLLQAGGQNLAAGKHMNLRGFAMCTQAPVALADLAVTATAAPSPAVVGQPLTYTLTLANHGGDATGVRLEQDLPGTVAFVSADRAECTAAAGKLTCAVGALAAGASVTVNVLVTPGEAGFAGSTASATLDGPDGDPDDNSADVIVQVLAAPRVHPTLAAGGGGSGRVGEAIAGHATLAGGDSPTGTITFSVFAPADTACANPLATSTAAVAGNAIYASAPFTPTAAGTYRWTAAYGGDGANEPAGPTGCGDGAVTVKAVPVLVLEASAAGASATLTGGAAIGGTITFNVYSDAVCAAPLATSTVEVAGNGRYASAPFAAPGPGTYRWSASYSGDDRNTPAGPGDCSAAVFTVAVVAAGAPPAVVAPLPKPKPKPSNAFTVRSAKGNRSGRLTLSLEASGPGRFTGVARMSGSSYGKVARTLRSKGRLTLTIKPTAKAKRALARHTRVRVKVSLTFTPAGGTPRTRTATITIRRS